MRAGAATVVLLALGAQAPAPQPPSDIRLYRLDCGRGDLSKNFFSDTRAYPDDATIGVVSSCYLIKHGTNWLLWDTGFGADTLGKPRGLTVELAPQLAALGVKPADIGIVGISHSHGDHTGQAKAFPQAKLLIGAREFDAMFGPNPTLADAGKPLAGWADGKNVAKVASDIDVYRDGTVIAIGLPGHTPGHLGLMVKLPKSGWVILSGDQYHFRENRAKRGVPGFNYDRAQTLASHERVEALVANLKARFVIQHDPEDAKAFPVAPAYLD